METGCRRISEIRFWLLALSYTPSSLGCVGDFRTFFFRLGREIVAQLFHERPPVGLHVGNGFFGEHGSPASGRRFADEGFIAAGVERRYPFLALRLFHLAHVGGGTSFDGLVDTLCIGVEAHELGYARQFALLILLQIFIAHQEEAIVSLTRRR